MKCQLKLTYVLTNCQKKMAYNLNVLAEERIGDALARVILDYPFPDFIIKYKNDLKEENHIKRQNFTRLLLNTSLIVEHETEPNGFTYMKITAPFERLCEQAQQMKLKLSLNVFFNFRGFFFIFISISIFFFLYFQVIHVKLKLLMLYLFFIFFICSEREHSKFRFNSKSTIDI